MAKYATIYKESKPLEMAKQSIETKCNYMLYAIEYDEENLRKFMMNYMYCGFNVVPKEKRYNGMRMSISDLCMQVGGLLAVAMNDVLTSVGDIVTGERVESDKLVEILYDAMLFEVNTLLGLGYIHESIYKALVRVLFIKDGKGLNINEETPLSEVEQIFMENYKQREVLCG